LTSLILKILLSLQPKSNYSWVIAAGGAAISLIGILFWHTQFSNVITLVTWSPVSLFQTSPTWMVDGISWPYALSIAGLATAVIWTSVIRPEDKGSTLSGILLFSALGILAITSANILTLILVWSSIDLMEMILSLRSIKSVVQDKTVVISFAFRSLGTVLLLLAGLAGVSNGLKLTFSSSNTTTGLLLVLAACVRLGAIIFQQSRVAGYSLGRGFGTLLPLVSAAASLSLLAKIGNNIVKSPLYPFLLLAAVLTALYAGWKWFQAVNETAGISYWVMGMASFSIAACLRNNPLGTIGWGIMLTLGGGLLFLYSARQKKILWLPLIGLLGFSSLPYSLLASAWQTENQSSWISIIPFLPAQGLFMAGYIRHAFRTGETSIGSQDKWVRLLYPAGLLFLAAITILLGLWGWKGAGVIGQWWAAIAVICLSASLLFLDRILRNKTLPGNFLSTPFSIINIGLNRFVVIVFGIFRHIAEVITSSLEGEGGLLWSLLLLALVLSILAVSGQ